MQLFLAEKRDVLSAIQRLILGAIFGNGDIPLSLIVFAVGEDTLKGWWTGSDN